MNWLARKSVERLLGMTLPADTEELHYFKSAVSSDLSGYDAWITFKSSRESYQELLKTMELEHFSDTGPNVYLPFSWKMADENRDDSWWNPDTDTPNDSASGTIGLEGWIVTKYEDGYVYIVMSDTGKK